LDKKIPITPFFNKKSPQSTSKHHSLNVMGFQENVFKRHQNSLPTILATPMEIKSLQQIESEQI